MADDKKQNGNNTNPNNVNVNKPVQQTPAPRKLVVDDGDVYYFSKYIATYGKLPNLPVKI